MDRRARWAIQSMRSQTVRCNWVTTTPGTQPRAAEWKEREDWEKTTEKGIWDKGKELQKRKGLLQISGRSCCCCWSLLNQGATLEYVHLPSKKSKPESGSGLKSLSCHMPCICGGRSGCTGPSGWETRQDPFSPLTSTSSPRGQKREIEILPCDGVHENIFRVIDFLRAVAANKGDCVGQAPPRLVSGEGTRRTKRQAWFIPWFAE